ncbi:hypothetical protein SRHO_G00253320 [Serrasalmus rhombeus]
MAFFSRAFDTLPVPVFPQNDSIEPWVIGVLRDALGVYGIVGSWLDFFPKRSGEAEGMLQTSVKLPQMFRAEHGPPAARGA